MTFALIPVLVKRPYIVRQWAGESDKAQGLRCVESYDPNLGRMVQWAEAMQDIQTMASINTSKICAIIQLEHHTNIIYEAGKRTRLLRSAMRAEDITKNILYPLIR